jgi:hypothetical protein
VKDEAMRLGSIELTDLVKDIITEEDVKRITPFFVPAINAILSVMRLQDSKVAAKAKKPEMIATLRASQALSLPTSSGSTSITQKRAAPDPIAIYPAAKRSRQTRKSPSPPIGPKTPDHQSTHPADPNLTGSTDQSGGTTESKDEETTKWLINLFLMNTLTVLGAPFRTLSWQQDQSKLELVHTYISNFETNCTASKMRQRSNWAWRRL